MQLSRQMFVHLALFLVALSGCASVPTTVNRDRLVGLQRGASFEEVDKALSPAKPSAIATIELDGQAFEARWYGLITGASQQVMMTCGKYGCIPVVYPVFSTSPFMVIFVGELKRVLTWGLEEELGKAEDPALVKAVEELKTRRMKPD